MIISLLSTFNLALRGISVFIRIKSVTYLKAACYLNAGLFGVVGFLLYGFGFRVFLVYSTAFLYPFITFMFLPTMFTLPSNFGLTLSADNASKMMMSYAFGEAIFTSVVGYLMEWIHPMALFGFLLAVGVAMGLSFHRLVQSMIADGKTMAKDGK